MWEGYEREEEFEKDDEKDEKEFHNEAQIICAEPLSSNHILCRIHKIMIPIMHIMTTKFLLEARIEKLESQ